MIKVSVIVPIYNSEKYMSKCIESIIGQTLKEIEIILINDGSNDESGKIAEIYAEKDYRIKVIHQKNSGPSRARNVGIKLAKGRYLGFVDSDDYIEKDMYEILYNLATENEAKVAMCNYKEVHVFDNTSEIIESNLNSNEIYYREGIEKNIISTFTKDDNYGFYSFWNKIYSREWINDIDIKIDENREHGEDWLFNINIFNKLDSFICTDKSLYNYIHINENSLMAKYRENQFDLFLDGRKKVLSIIDNRFINNKELDKRFMYETSTYIIRTLKNVTYEKKRKKLIYDVLSNEEFIKCCNNKLDMKLQYKLIAFLVRNNLIKVAYHFYKCIYNLR